MLNGRILSDTHFTISTLSKSPHQDSTDNAKRSTYRVSVSVWALCEYVTLPFPVLSNTAVIDPSRSSAPLSASLADAIFLASSDFSTISVPQHLIACARRLFVDALSFVSR